MAVTSGSTASDTVAASGANKAFSVANFRSELVYDGARPNLFEVTLPFPTVAGLDSTTASRKLTFMCKAAQMPASTMGVATAHYFGRESKHAGNRTFGDWTVTIINDEDFMVRKPLEQWSNAMNSHKGNLRSTQAIKPSDYCQDAEITHYGKTGNVLRTYKMIGMFPTEISPIDLDWGTMDTIEEFTVTFAYQWWEVEGATT